jgi:threonine dehydrogenase-like Zn-dependent dehydrogenase
VLVTGLGPVGLAVGLLAKAMGAPRVIGADLAAPRLELARAIGAVDDAVVAGEGALAEVQALTGGEGCEVAVDCSGAPAGGCWPCRGTRRFGRCAMVGEGNRVEFDVSQTLIHPQITVYGSWVTSIGHMEELVEKAGGLEPEAGDHRHPPLPPRPGRRGVPRRRRGQSGKVCIVME